MRLLFAVALLLSSLCSFCQTKDTVIDSRFVWTDLQKKWIHFYSDSANHILSSHQKAMALQRLQELLLIDACYIGFDNKVHVGQLVCHNSVAGEVKKIFAQLLQWRFPVYGCKPISEFHFDDVSSMKANNTTMFDYRFKTGSHTMSKHSDGLAIDINPVQNPYQKGSDTLPPNHNESNATGRIRPFDKQGNQVILLFKKYGWAWGGNWHSLKDYMHFEKQ